MAKCGSEPIHISSSLSAIRKKDQYSSVKQKSFNSSLTTESGVLGISIAIVSAITERVLVGALGAGVSLPVGARAVSDFISVAWPVVADHKEGGVIELNVVVVAIGGEEVLVI